MGPELHIQQEVSAAMRKAIISLVVGAAIFVPTTLLADGMPGAKEAPKGSSSASGTPADKAGATKVTQAFWASPTSKPVPAGSPMA